MNKDEKEMLYMDGEGLEERHREYFNNDAVLKDINKINDMAEAMAIFISKVPCESRCKAIAQTKLQECVMWFKEGVKKETE